MPALALLAALAACDGGTQASRQSRRAHDQLSQVRVTGPERRVVVLGTVPFGSNGPDDDATYPQRLQAALRKRGINARVMGPDIHSRTTADVLAELANTIDNRSRKPDLVIVSLGAEDMLQGKPAAETRANLAAILERLQGRRIRVLLLGAMASPAWRQNYALDFNPIYPDLSRRFDVTLVPVFLQSSGHSAASPQQVSSRPVVLSVDEMVTATVDDVVDALRPG